MSLVLGFLKTLLNVTYRLGVSVLGIDRNTLEL